ncbi:MAG TPA: gamma-glutamyl-gamma-aminobutyrate hydrolase family protein [Clostridia bacterium]|nr:gamma-glutamyl-gamma-aminobutyrate hydrolase family protein [Clostridia bacterium]
MKPVIGITTFMGDKTGYYSISGNYTDSVFLAGGIPVCIPVIYNEKDYDSYMNIIDCIIFTGGADISPLYYGENPTSLLNNMSSIRDDYEIGLFKTVYENNVPILGICRGIQLINVALGGSLYQDINAQLPDTLGHSPGGTAVDELYHSINIEKKSKLYNIFNEDRINVNSFHHQAVKKLGNNLVVSAMSDDGIIEGIESTDRKFLIGIQCHPECLTKRYPMFLKLFRELVLAAGK